MTWRSPRTAPRHSVLLTLVGALLLALVSAGAVGSPASADGEPAAAPGKVRGAILAKGGSPKVDVRYFALDWTYLGAVKAPGGGYSLTLAPGTYRIQVVDRAPVYDVKRFAPTDAVVTVTSGATTVQDIRLRHGAAIGGTVRVAGKPAKSARVVAANSYEQSFETTTDKQGNYAIGGLPPGRYSVFTYDRKRDHVGKSTFAGKLKKGSFKSISPNLTKKAGSLIVDLYAGSTQVGATVYLTAVSKETGQFWTVPSSGGVATFRGLYPGRYDIVAPAYGAFPAQTHPVTDGLVRAGRAAFGSFTWTP